MPTPQETLLGRLAVKNGFVTEEELAKAIQVQESLLKRGEKKALGEILVDEGFLTSAQLEKLLKAQQFNLARREDMLYGKIAIRNGFVSEQRVKEALEEQMQAFQMGKEPPRLGQILMRKGLLLRQQHNAILKTQKRLREQAKRQEEKDPLRNIHSCPFCEELVRQCIYCGELMKPEQSVCPHCGQAVRPS